ncbi:hypothetical protein BV509_20420 [Rhodovulum sulfidophilum]|uniref:DNA-binding protein n=2 Tax=Rhodovulum TaxID=34008 RepID=A0ABS1RJ96_9RHOB|nr:hypothetical protein [Rhodovulum visakhapatnamense]MBL3571358.1 DNA-binding protein [Rhodovulum visakhapatnamense]MBL3579688.1 DNA-binding protein [Rhodovulum visakhapatnamense]OLS46482.1 hypothetical protein BV509_20420 [Rhodovulum sulfidophilum]RAP40017.1 hypothetical protein BYZ73_17135 [Rhodovulum viride]
MPLTLCFAPRLMPAGQAAHYLGVSVSKLRTLPITSKQLDGKRVWDLRDLDAYADNLPTHGESDQGNTCDALFTARAS